jgi:hypothetical protein
MVSEGSGQRRMCESGNRRGNSETASSIMTESADELSHYARPNSLTSFRLIPHLLCVKSLPQHVIGG